MADRNQIAPFPLRLKPKLKDWLKHRAIDNHRSLNQEIEHRLEQGRQREQKEVA